VAKNKPWKDVLADIKDADKVGQELPSGLALTM